MKKYIDCGNDLTKEQKYDLIDFFHKYYHSTAQEVKEFSCEYTRVTGDIMSCLVPLNLVYLIDFQQTLLEEHSYLLDYLLKNGIKGKDDD